MIGLDVSGSFRATPYFDESIQFAALYIYGHLNGLGGLRPVTDLFVGTLGGERVGEPKSFHPIQDFTGKSPQQIAADLRAWFPETDPFTTTPDLQLSKLPPQARLNRNAREYEAHLRMRGFVILRTSYRQLDPNE